MVPNRFSLSLLLLIGVCAPLESFGQSAAVSNTVTLTAGFSGSVTGPNYTGFISGTMGSVSPANTSDGHAYIRISDDEVNCAPKRGCAGWATVEIGGFALDPTQSWLYSVTANGVTLLGANAGYSFSDGTATWHFVPGHFNFVSGSTYTVTIAHNLVGYINPKFFVVGVTYAPPGPSLNTFVNYENSNFVGTTTSLSNSFASSVESSVSLSAGFAVAVAHGNVTATTSNTTTLTTKNSSSITTSIQVQNGEKTFGTANYFAPVDHDYDVIWVWLNPAIIMTAGIKSVALTGLGYDTTDQDGMDIVPVELGYLNGHFGAIPSDIQSSFNRSWATDQIWGPGDGAALTSGDLAEIAAADPFSVTTYGSDVIGYTPPTETSDNRFTLTSCSSTASFNYVQASPSQSAGIYTCTLTYTNTSTQAQDITQTQQESYSVDESLSGAFVLTVSADIKTTYTLTYTTDAQSSITSTTTSTGALSVQGPPCNNVSPDVGPCVPVYDSADNQPTQFEVYQDNMYGTFMFAPVHYY